MVKLKTLERPDCKILWGGYEPEEAPTEPIQPGLSMENADQWFEQMQKDQGKSQYYLGVFTHEDRLIGDIQLSSIHWRNRTAEINFGIMRAKDRGQGYGTDAAKVMLDFAFDHLDLNRISARTCEHNEPAIHVLERKLGFVQEGTEREAVFIGGKRWDRLIYGLLKRDWIAMKMNMKVDAIKAGLVSEEELNFLVKDIDKKR